MRKFILLFTIMFGLCVSAQTIESQKVFDNVEVTVKGGVSALTHPGCNDYVDWGHTLKASTSIGISKWITPKFGVGIESTVGWENGTLKGLKFNEGWRTFKGKNWVSYVDVLATSRFNLNNILHGYKGTQDKVEFIPTIGIGWVHGFKYRSLISLGPGMMGSHLGTKHTNDIMTKYAVDVKFNLSNHFGLIVTPYYAFNLTGGKFNRSNNIIVETNKPKFDSRNSWYGIEAGLTYRFGKQFTICPYTYTEAEVEALREEINELRRMPTVKKVIVEKEVIKEIPSTQYVVFFNKDSYDLTDTAIQLLNTIPSGTNVVIVGSASPEGNDSHNLRLSQDRAYVVKSHLESRKVNVLDTKSSGTELGSRVVIVKVQ